MTIFISCSFDPHDKRLAEWVQSTFKQSGINAFISGQTEAKPLPESITTHIRQSEAVLTIITEKHSAWVQNEIGIAYASGKPVYALVQEGVKVEGILPHITIYKTFDPSKPATIKEPVENIVLKVLESRKAQAAVIGLLVLGLLALILLGSKK